MVSKRRSVERKPWLKERPPWWAIGVFAALAAVVVGMLVWGAFFYEGG